jgi:hypothetical protein
MRVLVSFTLSLLLSLTASPALALGGTPGTPGSSCVGLYSAIVKFPQCSNSFVLSNEVLVMSKMTSTQPGTFQGNANLANFTFSQVPLPGGNCAKVPGSETNLGIDLSGTSSGTAGTLTMTAFDGRRFDGAFSQTANGVLDGKFSGQVWGPDVQATFNCVLKESVQPGPFLLAAKSFGSGLGKIVSAPTGIDCGTTCGANFAAKTVVTLTATAAADSYFAGWSGACTGIGNCSVTMDAAKAVVATFTLRPFLIKNEGIVITPAQATIRTVISFNPADVGKRGSVFVTARVPRAALGTVLRMAGGDWMPDQPTGADSSSTVLVQETASGWQMVVNGQLVPYTTGVLGDETAAQNILDTTDVNSLKGAEFCVGYGTSAAEMTASGRMVPVATVPDPSATGASAGSCVVTTVSPLTGLWWNANESGWGMSITQRETMIFIAWYTYGSDGKPLWYVMSSCPVVGAGCTGDLYKVTGGTPPGLPWSGTGKIVSKVGTGTLSFSDNDTGVFNYSLNGVAGARNITRQMFGSGDVPPTVDYSALWWNAAESGWGVSLTQQYGVIFLAMYVYDADGKPIWYVASNCAVTGTACTGDLYQVNGGTEPAAAWNGANKVVASVGSVSLSFTDASNAIMTYTINGTGASKAITRQLF